MNRSTSSENQEQAASVISDGKLTKNSHVRRAVSKLLIYVGGLDHLKNCSQKL